jgi:hypothetical protein
MLSARAPPVQAEEAEVTTGHVLVCDTADEVEAVLGASEGDMSRAADDDQRALRQGIMQRRHRRILSGRRGEDGLPDGLVRTIKVDLIGCRAGESWMRMDKPMAQQAKP